jgi:uncharacterized damage-inducible protein DinB
MIETLRKYCRYNRWANQRVVDFVRPLPEAELHRTAIASFPTLHGSLFHLYGAQDIWLSRLAGNSPAEFPKAAEIPSRDVLDALLSTSDRLVEIAARPEDALQQVIAYTNLSGDSFSNTVADILMHVVNHGTYHRGQIIAQLRQLGHEQLFSTDYIAFTRQQ